jgi:glycosyltransferase involved in cell wall biosynthesis
MAGLRNVYVRYRNSMVAYLEHKIGHTTGFKRQLRRLRWLAKFRRIYGDRDMITVSEALRHEVADVVKVKPRSLRTIYNPFDFEALRARGGEPAPVPTVPYIVCAARYAGRKRQDLLLEAFARARVPHKLVLLGGVYTESDRRWKASIHALIRRLKLADRVIALDFQNNPYPWIKNADLFAMASDNEGLPSVLIEALILGTPVVSTDCPTGPREILDGDLACFLSPVGEAEPLARNIERALAAYPPISDARLARFEAGRVIDTYLGYCAGK